jgi:serine/threonine protein kinase
MSDAADNGSIPENPEHIARMSRPAGTPSHIGRYEVLRVLGLGTFGRVYLAHDPEIERDVAIKVPKDFLPAEEHRRFLREARAIADLHHPNICPVYDVGTHDGLPYLVMRYVKGGTLNDVLERGLVEPTEALRCAEQIARGLEAAHARKVIHRDLKPANVLYDDVTRTALIADFGLAKWLEQSAATSGGIKGTPEYMAPEQWDTGSNGRFGPVSPRTDVYALGVMLFRFLTGAPLFTGAPLELMTKHCTEPPRRPSEVRPGLDPRFDALVLKALAKQQTDRYPSAREFADAIAECLRPAVTPAVPVPPPPIPATLAPNQNRGTAQPRKKTKAKQQRMAPVPVAPRAPAPAKTHDPVRVPQRWWLWSFFTKRDPVPAPPRWRIDVRGVLSYHPAGSFGPWKEITDTPAEVTCWPGEVYKLQVDSSEGSNSNLARIADLAGLTALQSLNLLFCRWLTDRGLVHLKGLTALKELNLVGCWWITDRGLAHLKGLTALEELDLSYCEGTTDRGFAHLAGLPALQSLALSGCEWVTDKWLVHLKDLIALKELNLAYCKRITNDGLVHFKGLSALQYLCLQGCELVTSGAATALQRALPKCHILC